MLQNVIAIQIKYTRYCFLQTDMFSGAYKKTTAAARAIVSVQEKVKPGLLQFSENFGSVGIGFDLGHYFQDFSISVNDECCPDNAH